MKKKHIHILAYCLFAIFILGNIIFFATDYCFACEKTIINKEIKIKTIDKYQWRELSKQENLIILDIRTPKEFQSGNIENSVNIDFYSPQFKDELNKLDKNKTYLIYCRSGNRATQSLSIFEELNFIEVYNLEGGISKFYK